MTPDAFDAARAEFATRRVPLGALVDPLEGVPHAPDRIEAYRAAMARGDRFPPISVVRLFGRNFVCDGHKRLAAFRSFGSADVPVEVWPFRRWLGDQARQARRNAAKNRRIVLEAFRDRSEAARLLMTTLLHWRRVALALAGRLRR
jgi:hypothetical protein